jgi:hypothetical protein
MSSVSGAKFSIDVPINASGVEQRTAGDSVKVAVIGNQGVISAQIVEIDAKGHGTAHFSFPINPGAVEVVVGPPDATDDELPHLQTISRSITARMMLQATIKLPAIIIPNYHWVWWRHWCRTFTIHGRLVCANGKPVPAATVCAYDVDRWWWWSSQQQVGCAVTDINGAFTITFRWCCGWLPIWWWRLRTWHLEPRLIEQITPMFEIDPHIVMPTPSQQPSLAIFNQVLTTDTEPVGRLMNMHEVNPETLEHLRQPLVKVLGPNLALEKLRIWPWYPWRPWWDCTPDIIFRATQSCDGQTRVIVDESPWEVRWNIAQNSHVTLQANHEACCVDTPEQPKGNCMVFSSVCGSAANHIGGNFDAPAAPAGYLYPGGPGSYADMAYGGAVNIYGLFGDLTDIDYYEFELATDPSGSWNPLGLDAMSGFDRYYCEGESTTTISFNVTPIDGHLVIESREHYEAQHDPTSWNLTRFWIGLSRDQLIQWISTKVADGTYYLRLVGYKEAGGKLSQRQILPLCGSEGANSLVLTIDNLTGSLDPAADIVDVRIDGASVQPCSKGEITGDAGLEVDFVAYDQDAHLYQYTLIVTFDKNQSIDLLNPISAPGVTVTPKALGSIPAADYTGHTYEAAKAQGATAPVWRGGGMTLSIPKLRDVFKKTCCYQLELRVFKRSIVSCSGYIPRVLSFYTLMVEVDADV